MIMISVNFNDDERTILTNELTLDSVYKKLAIKFGFFKKKFDFKNTKDGLASRENATLDDDEKEKVVNFLSSHKENYDECFDVFLFAKNLDELASDTYEMDRMSELKKFLKALKSSGLDLEDTEEFLENAISERPFSISFDVINVD